MEGYRIVRCNACQRGKHKECPVTMMIVHLRWNMIRCQCDYLKHKLPRNLVCNVMMRMEYG